MHVRVGQRTASLDITVPSGRIRGQAAGSLPQPALLDVVRALPSLLTVTCEVLDLLEPADSLAVRAIQRRLGFLG